MNLQKIVGIIGVVVAIAAAFVSIPNSDLILLIAGLIVGFYIAREDHVRVIVSALALTAFAHYFETVPGVGKFLGPIVANFGLVVAGAAVMIVLRNIYARLMPTTKGAAGTGAG